jgi:hypothetical protein
MRVRAVGGITRRFIGLLIIVGLSVGTASGQPERLPFRVIVSSTEAASCYKSDAVSGKRVLIGSQLVRTPVFRSPDGRYRAYVEEEATAFKVAKSEAHRWSATEVQRSSECANTTRLFVAGPGTGPFRLVFLQASDYSHIRNGIGLVDWSPDGRQLMFILSWNTDATDFFPNCLLLYDPAYGVFKECGFAARAFQQKVNKECDVLVNPVGFSPEGKVVVTAQPFYVNDEMSEPACVDKNGTWLLDPESEKLSPLPDDYKVQHYGKFAEDRTKKP